MRLTCAQAAKLVRLNAGESLPRSHLNKALLAILQQGDVVRLEKSGSSYVVRGLPGKLASFIEQKLGVRDLKVYAEATPDNRSREVMAKVAGDSKALPSQPFDGVFIRSFGNCFVGDNPLHISSPGTAALITLGELPRLRIEAGHLIAVENARCLWYFEKTLRHFPDLMGLGYALVLRWHWGTVWRKWLEGWNGQLLYFPDYDPAGLKIFATEVLPQRPEAHLLIPWDFERVLHGRGERGLYLKQEKLLPLPHEHAEISRICLLLRKARKAFEQEALL
jgi:hypothetical protein